MHQAQSSQSTFCLTLNLTRGFKVVWMKVGELAQQAGMTVPAVR
jgi:hypothetical protein